MGNIHRRKRKKLRELNILKFLIHLLRLLLFIIVTGLILTTLFFLLIFRRNYFFDKPINSVLAYKDGIVIVSFDPSFDQLLIINVDGNINVVVSGGLGNYPLKSIYELSLNEKQGESLFKKSIMRNLHLPVYNVIDCRESLMDKLSIKKLILSCRRKSDIFDLIYLIYTKWKSANNVTEKNLSDYGMHKTDVSGLIYLLDEEIFNKLELDFSQNMEISDIVSVTLVTKEGSNLPLFVNDIIKILGGRVVRKENDDATQNIVNTCKIIGNDAVFLKNIQKIFNCKTKFSKDGETMLYFNSSYLETF